GDRILTLSGHLRRRSIVAELRRRVAEADGRPAALAGAAADLKAVRERRDQRQPEAERWRVALIRPRPKALPPGGDHDLELAPARLRGPLERPRLVPVGVQDHVVAGLGDD